MRPLMPSFSVMLRAPGRRAVRPRQPHGSSATRSPATRPARISTRSPRTCAEPHLPQRRRGRRARRRRRRASRCARRLPCAARSSGSASPITKPTLTNMPGARSVADSGRSMRARKVLDCGWADGNSVMLRRLDALVVDVDGRLARVRAPARRRSAARRRRRAARRATAPLTSGVPGATTSPTCTCRCVTTPSYGARTSV